MSGAMTVPRTIAQALDEARRFLLTTLLPTGQCEVTCSSVQTDGSIVTVDDDVLFTTLHVVLALHDDSAAEARELVARAVAYIRSERVEPGVWRFWNARHANSRFVWADADDTACAAHALALAGDPSAAARWMLTVNRDGAGRFFTWFAPRLCLTSRLGYWRRTLGDSSVARLLSFRRTQARYDDVDAVVNANVVAFLGPCAESERAVDYLIGVVRQGSEASSDKWYPEPVSLYHAVSRARAAGVSRFDEVRELIAMRVEAAAAANGQIGADELQTALGMVTWQNFGWETPLSRLSADYLLRRQLPDGGWSAKPFHYGGRHRMTCWASRALTTALCVQALRNEAAA